MSVAWDGLERSLQHQATVTGGSGMPLGQCDHCNTGTRSVGGFHVTGERDRLAVGYGEAFSLSSAFMYSSRMFSSQSA